MPRYTDADGIIAKYDKALSLARNDGAIAVLKFCKEIVQKAPTVSSDEVRSVGKWMLLAEQNPEDVKDGNYAYWCSRCYARDVHAKTQEVPYCWRCGAKMEVQDEQTD